MTRRAREKLEFQMNRKKIGFIYYLSLLVIIRNENVLIPIECQVAEKEEHLVSKWKKKSFASRHLSS